LSKTAETIRVFNLAKELKLDNKALIDVCQDLGFEKVKNQLNSLSPEQAEQVRKRVAEGPAKPAHAAAHPRPAAPAGPPVLPTKNLDQKVRTLTAPKPKAAPVAEQPAAEPAPEVVADVAPPTPDVTPEPAPVEVPAPEVAAAAPVAPPALGRGVEALLNPNRMPTLGRPQVRNLNPQQRPAPRPPEAAKPQPTPTAQTQAPVAHAPAPPVPPAVQVPAPVAQAPVPPPPVATPAPAPVAATPAPTPTPAAAVPPTPAPAPITPPPARPSLPPNVGGRPMNLSSGPRPVSQPQPGGPRPPQGNPQGPRPPMGGPSGPQAPRTNFAPPNPGPPRTYGVSTQRPGPGGGSGTTPPGGPRPPAPAPAKAGPPGQMKLTPEQIKKLREREQKSGQKLTTDQVAKQIIDAPPGGDANKPGGPDRAGSGVTRTPDRGPPRPGGRPGGESEEEKKKAAAGSAVSGRSGRHAGRQMRDRSADKGSVIISGGQVEMSEQQWGSRKGPRAALLAKMKRRGQVVVTKKEGPVEVTLPLTVRALSEAIGEKVGSLLKQLLNETKQLYTINSNIEFDVAELIAINKGITLVQKKQLSAKDLLLQRFKEQAEKVEIEKLVARPPIVVIMGHVDHGKTSLLDKIRAEYGLESDVVSTEAGGITQVLRAWRVEKDGKRVTFLDTPGHEAFTKMRARGANVTDIAVIVVAATDGVYPQTEEAIAHARAAEVDIIVAINKVDMPNANVDKTRRQLYQLNLLPDDMGGDIQFIETSAVTGQGIAELIEAINLQAELSDPPLVADPEHKPSGTCLEAYLDGEKGVMATLLVQQGTLRKGDIILCGASHGRVRAMFDDLGRAVEEAGPSTPVKVYGLDVVPDADDPFYFVEDIAEAAEIAEQERVLIREAELNRFRPVSLDSLREQNARAKITELKVILKAEARGSVEAIKKELEKLVHEEVRCRVLSAGIGAISEADVTLALTSPADTLVIGFNVTADDAALRLSEERGISLREYQIIYNLVDDVKAALEGRLKPIEEVVHLGRAVVRDTFKVSKVGTIAGCYVTSGVIERSNRVRVIREGTVIYPPAEKTLGLDSLKRFKDDAKEVREGFECGMKITGFDDVKVGDVIEAYRIDIKQRTL
jgi:translation initiation factor IF-2